MKSFTEDALIRCTIALKSILESSAKVLNLKLRYCRYSYIGVYSTVECRNNLKYVLNCTHRLYPLTAIKVHYQTQNSNMMGAISPVGQVEDIYLNDSMSNAWFFLMPNVNIHRDWTRTEPSEESEISCTGTEIDCHQSAAKRPVPKYLHPPPTSRWLCPVPSPSVGVET